MIRKRPAAAFAPSALLLVNTCVAAPGLEAKHDAKAPPSSASLAAALDSTNTATRFYAVDSLGKIGGSATIVSLVKALHDPDACVRIAAAKTLGHSADPAARAYLSNVLKTEKDADVWNMAAKPLMDKGPAAIPALLEVFWKAEAAETRLSIGRALSGLGWEPKTREEKIAYYASNLIEYSDELASMGPVAIPSLIKLMAEGDEECRVTVVQCLNCITDHRVYKPLVKALVDPSPTVRKAALVSIRVVSFDSVCKLIGNKGYLLLLACRFLAPLVYALIKLISYFRHRHDVKSGSSQGSGTIARLAKALFSLDLWFVLSCSASLLVLYMYTNQYIKEVTFGLLYGPLCVLFPAIVMVVVFDIVRIAFKAAGMLKRESGKALFTARPLLWLKRTAAVVWILGLVYYFVSADLGYVRISNAFKNRAMHAASAAAQASKKDILTPEEEARKFASIVSQAKEAVKAVDARYLDQQQKEQVMETFVKLVSIRSPSRAEGRISNELKQIMEKIGAKEIDCRKGDTSAPFNLVMEFPATEDLKDAPAILLNAHIDTVDRGRCTPERLEFDKVKSNFYHRDNGSYGADDKSGVTMIVEALRTLKRDYWDKGYSHRRILVVFTAQEESGSQGAQYLATHCRGLFDNLDFSFTVDGWLWGDWGNYEYPQTPHLAGVFKSKAGTFKARQIVTIMEKFAKERNQPIFIGRRASSNLTIDANKFPPEAYKVAFFHTSNHGLITHGQERNNVGQLIDYVDMLINVLKQLDAEYVKAVNTPRGEETKISPVGTGASSAQLHGVAIGGMGMSVVSAIAAVGVPVVAGALVMLGVCDFFAGKKPPSGFIMGRG